MNNIDTLIQYTIVQTQLDFKTKPYWSKDIAGLFWTNFRRAVSELLSKANTKDLQYIQIDQKILKELRRRPVKYAIYYFFDYLFSANKIKPRFYTVSEVDHLYYDKHPYMAIDRYVFSALENNTSKDDFVVSDTIYNSVGNKHTPSLKERKEYKRKVKEVSIAPIVNKYFENKIGELKISF